MQSARGLRLQATCVYHVAAELGSTEGATPQSVYDGGMVATQKLLDSVIK